MVKQCLGGAGARTNTLVAPATSDDNRFSNLFFKNKDKVIETFQWFLDKTTSQTSSKLILYLSYFCLSQTDKQTIPFPQNWRTDFSNFRAKSFRSSPQDAINYGQWISFLRGISESGLSGREFSINNVVATKESKFFWEKFFQAYLYFVGLSKTDPYSDNSFLAFLDNLKKRVIHYHATQLSKMKWLSYLPGVDLQFLGQNRIDARWLFSLDPDTLNLDSLSSQQLKDFYLLVPFSKYDRFVSDLVNERYIGIIKKFQTIFNNSGFREKLKDISTNSLGIRKIFFKDQEYSLQNLFSLFTFEKANIINTTDENYEHLAFNEIVNLVFADKTQSEPTLDTPEKLQKLFDNTKIQLLTRLQLSLETLQKVDPKTTQLPINEKKYTIDQLLQATNQLLNDPLDPKVIAQIKALFSNSIYATDITKATNQLKKYGEIIDFLNQLKTDQKLTSLKINDQDYSFTSLLADAKKEFIDFSQDSFTELQNLVDQDISLEKLETAYQESLSSSQTQEPSESTPETKSSSKKSTNQNLAIGLGTAGGVVALAGAGGFAYWFVKIRKS